MSDEENENNVDIFNSMDLPQSIAVIDNDKEVRLLTTQILKDSGIRNVDDFGDSTLGWDAIQNKKYDMIILDWKLEGVSGAAIINRCRQSEELLYQPIFIVSDYLKQNDFSLLSEIPFTRLIEKPFVRQLFIHKIKDLYEEYLHFQRDKDKISEILEALHAGKTVSFKQFMTFIKKMPNPKPIGLGVIRDLINCEKYTEAEKVIDIILDKEPECLLVLTELGKVYLKTSRQKEAKAVLQKANTLSPANIERLCILGDESLKDLQTDRAESYFKVANSIDKEDKTAKAGLTLTSNVNTYLRRSNVTKIPSSYASLLNAIGVSIVREDQYGEGIDHYQSAMKFVDDADVKARLMFNAGLGFLRWNKTEEAYVWFDKSLKISKGSFLKAKRHVKKLEAHFKKNGIDIPFTEAEPIAEIEIESLDEAGLEEPLINIAPDMKNETAEQKAREQKQNDIIAGIDNDELFEPVGEDVMPDDATAPVEKISSEQLMEKLPAAEKIVNMLIAANEDLTSNLDELSELYKIHGEEMTNKAVAEAVKNGTPQSSEIAKLLADYKKAS